MLRLITIIARKDWRLFWADRRAALLCFLVPILLASAFGAVFDKPSSAETKLPVVIVNESADASAIVNDLLASPRLEATLITRDEALKTVESRSPGVAVIFPASFTMPKTLNDSPKVEILHHPLAKQESQWAEGVLAEAMMKRLAKDTFGVAPKPPFEATSTAVGGERFNSYSHSFSGMSLQYLLFWGMESGLMLLRERSRGVWRRLRASPAPLAAILLGRALATAIIAMLQVSITFAFGYFAFDVTVSLASFAALAVVISLLAAATGLLVAALGGTEARARSVCILAILGVSMLGGLWLPSFLLPAWVKTVSLALPTTWAMQGLDAATWQGRGSFASAAVVLAFSLAFLAVALVKFRAAESRNRKGLT